MQKNSTVLTGIDIGTSKIRVVIGEASASSDNINIIGYSEKESEGVTKGEITDMTKVSSILNSAVKEAENVSNSIIDSDSLYVGINGNHITSKDGFGTVLIDTEDNTVTSEHVQEALKSSKGLLTPPDCMLINSIDNTFSLDNDHHVEDPVGQTAGKLEASSFLIYANRNRVDNFINSVKELGF